MQATMQCFTEVSMRIHAHRIIHNPLQPPAQYAGAITFHSMEIFWVPYIPLPSLSTIHYPCQLNDAAITVSYAFVFEPTVDKVKLPLVCWASKEKIAIRDYIYDIDVYGTGLVLSLDYLDGQYGLLKVVFQNFSIGEIMEAEFFAYILVPVDKLALTWIEKCMVLTIQCQNRYSVQTSLVFYEDQVEDSNPMTYTPYGPSYGHDTPFVLQPIIPQLPVRPEPAHCSVGVQIKSQRKQLLSASTHPDQKPSNQILGNWGQLFSLFPMDVRLRSEFIWNHRE
ncbi:hypothetical protein ARMGADRAFT_1040251 [Armillaria gallica]|uniref:Uncharacterized protein n=1 Tax=Armillaria gallica TaxID=47427 RepID=A0A2H3CLU4_ARMGA|nr:hypothetical protein ARMGADRAFT_1040251 [Armillaria gallica]